MFSGLFSKILTYFELCLLVVLLSKILWFFFSFVSLGISELHENWFRYYNDNIILIQMYTFFVIFNKYSILNCVRDRSVRSQRFSVGTPYDPLPGIRSHMGGISPIFFFFYVFAFYGLNKPGRRGIFW